MATAEQITSFRGMIDDVDSPQDFIDADLGVVIDSFEDINLAAAMLWRQKAAKYSRFVNVTESGSSRSLSDLHKNALAMAGSYSAAASGVIAATPVAATTRPIERP